MQGRTRQVVGLRVAGTQIVINNTADVSSPKLSIEAERDKHQKHVEDG